MRSMPTQLGRTLFSHRWLTVPRSRVLSRPRVSSYILSGYTEGALARVAIRSASYANWPLFVPSLPGEHLHRFLVHRALLRCRASGGRPMSWIGYGLRGGILTTKYPEGDDASPCGTAARSTSFGHRPREAKPAPRLAFRMLFRAMTASPALIDCAVFSAASARALRLTYSKHNPISNLPCSPIHLT